MVSLTSKIIESVMTALSSSVFIDPIEDVYGDCCIWSSLMVNDEDDSCLLWL